MPIGLEDQVADLRRRALRRYVFVLVSTALFVVVADVVVLVNTHPAHRHEAHGHRPRYALPVAIVIALLSFTTAVLLWRRLIGQRRQTGWIPLSLGLSRAQRRRVQRNVRAGTPSADPLMRYVETLNAHVLRDLERNQKLVLPVVAVIVVGAVVRFWNTARIVSILCLAAVVLMAATYPKQRGLYRGARRYLAAVDSSHP